MGDYKELPVLKSGYDLVLELFRTTSGTYPPWWIEGPDYFRSLLVLSAAEASGSLSAVADRSAGFKAHN